MTLQTRLGLAALLLGAFSTTPALAAQTAVVDTIEATGFTLIFDSKPIANLTFQLDCMAGLIAQ